MTEEETNRTLDAIFGKESTPRPKPAPPKKPLVGLDAAKIEKAAEAVQELAKVLATPPAPKPPFVRKPHLTDSPFRQHEGLKALKQQMEKKQPRRGQRRPNKEKK